MQREPSALPLPFEAPECRAHITMDYSVLGILGYPGLRGWLLTGANTRRTADEAPYIKVKGVAFA